MTTESGGKGLACVTLRQDIEVKFKQDFTQRRAGEYEKYVFFCIAHLTAKQKVNFISFCAATLEAELVPYDIEALRSLLDSSSFRAVRDRYLNIQDQRKSEKQIAESIITFLENKRVLYNPTNLEVPNQCTHSILVIRDYLAEKLEDLDRGSELAKNLRTMQAECREFLDATQKFDHDPFLYHGHHYEREYYGSLGKLRKAFGFYLVQLVLAYGLTIGGNLTSILPASES